MAHGKPSLSHAQKAGEVKNSWLPGGIDVSKKSQTFVQVKKKKKSRLRKLLGYEHAFMAQWGQWMFEGASKNEVSNGTR